MIRSLLTPVTKRHIERKILRTPPLHLFRIIQDVDQHSRFLPWCTQSQIIRVSSDGRSFDGRLVVGLPPFYVEEYVSRVSVIPERMTIEATSIESKMFDSLRSRWTLGDVELSRNEIGCDVDFEVELTVSDPLIINALDQVLQQVAGKQVEAFERRCHEVPIPHDIAKAGRRLYSTTNNNQPQNQDDARVQAARSYLEGWIGNNKENHNQNAASSPSSPRGQTAIATKILRNSSMLVSSSSYLLATLRLEKADTPQSIAERLQQYNDKNMDNSTISFASYHYNESNDARQKQWMCPIVLDLRAWRPDGSPHYQPRCPGTLSELVNVLHRHGITVIGVHGTPEELQKEAKEELGLPGMFLQHSTSNGGSNQQPTTGIHHGSSNGNYGLAANYITLEDVIQMVAKQQEKETPMELCPSPSNVLKRSDETRTGKERQSHTLPPTQPSSPHVIQTPPTATIYHGSVRSGQQVSSGKGQSLIVLGHVSSGGEVMSDGDITIFGRLRGKALAGLAALENEKGTNQAVIIATSTMDPELVCIGHVFSTVDTVEDFGIPSGTPAMVSLKRRRTSNSANDDDELVFEPIITG